jgi:hypothetical protein
MNLRIINQLDALSRSNGLGLITGGVEKGTIQERRRKDNQFPTSFPRMKAVPIIQVNGPKIVFVNSVLALKERVCLIWSKLKKIIGANSSKLISATIAALIVSLFEKFLSRF